MADRHVGATGEGGPGQRQELGRQRRLTRAHDLGDRVGDGRDEVVLEVRPRAHERRVLVGPRVLGPDDEPLEVVEVRIEPARPRPDHDVPRDVRGQGRVDQQAAGTGRIRGRHLADEGALVADQRRDEVELAREPQRARDHPTGDQAHQDPAPAGRADRPARVGPDHQVVADERPVDVESDQADGQDGFGRHDAGHRTMMPDGRSRRWRRGFRPRAGGRRPTLSSLPGSPVPRAAGRPGPSRPCRSSPADARRRSPRWPAPGPPRSRAARRRRRPARPATDRRAGR